MHITRIYIGFLQVVHKAFIDVNEEGSETTASTGVNKGTLLLPPAFDARQPFLFFIRENSSGAILFLGRISRPDYI